MQQQQQQKNLICPAQTIASFAADETLSATAFAASPTATSVLCAASKSWEQVPERPLQQALRALRASALLLPLEVSSNCPAEANNEALSRSAIAFLINSKASSHIISPSAPFLAACNSDAMEVVHSLKLSLIFAESWELSGSVANSLLL